MLYQITAWAGLWVGLIPLVSYPILLASQQGFKDLSAGLVAGTLLAVVLLFAAPVVLIGCVSPFAIRLLLKDVETGGNTAGRVYALSTAGSILGTFLPVFWFGLRVFFFIFLYVWVRGTLPRFRYDQLMGFTWKVLLPLALANIAVTSLFVALQAR